MSLKKCKNEFCIAYELCGWTKKGSPQCQSFRDEAKNVYEQNRRSSIILALADQFPLNKPINYLRLMFRRKRNPNDPHNPLAW